MCTGIDTDVSYPHAPSTPPEPAPHDPSLGNSITDPRSSMGSSGGLKTMTDNNPSTASIGQQRLVKASTMPSTGSHPSLEDVTCRTLQFKNAFYIVLVLLTISAVNNTNTITPKQTHQHPGETYYQLQPIELKIR